MKYNGKIFKAICTNRISDNSRMTSLISAMVFIAVYLLTAGCSRPEDSIFTVGIVNDISILAPSVDGFKAGMEEFGYVEGGKVKYIYNGILNNNDKDVDAEIRNILSQGVDMLLTLGNHASLRAKKAVDGTDMPVIFCGCNRPITAGLIETMAHPGLNITGIAVADSAPKALEWLKAVTPGLKKVYMPYNPDDGISMVSLSGLDEAASHLGLEFIHHKVHSVEEAVAGIENLPKDVGAIFRIPSPTLDSRNSELSRAAIKRGLPVGARLPLDKEVLVTFATDLYDTGKSAARLANQIRLGVKPADIPVETADAFLTINLKTAEEIGIHIPNDILVQAKIIIR